MSDCKHAKRPVRHLFVCGENFIAFPFVHFNRFSVFEIKRTTFDNFVGRAFRELQNIAVFVLVDGGHHLTHGIERYFAYAGINLFLFVFIESERRRVIDKRALGRFSDCLSFVLVELGVRAKRHCVCKQIFVAAVMVDNRHFILSKRARFVRADDLRATERFDSGEFSYYRVAL